MPEVRLLAVGDLHLRKTVPALRTDDFLAEQKRKLDFIFQTAIGNDCGLIVFPGDVFDRPDAPHGLVEAAIREFRGSFDYLFVFGQHDLRYHTSDKQNTPLGVLVSALFPRAHILTPETAFEAAERPLRVRFYGCSWGEPLPEKLEKGVCNVVVMHRPISNVPLPWDHEDFLLASDLVKKCKADLFITGDNHSQFIETYDGVPVVNMGSVMRMTTKQVEHKPALALIAIQPDKPIRVKRIEIPVRPDVFDMDQVEEKQAKDERIAAFVTGLKDTFNPEFRFLDNLRLAMKEAPEGVCNVIDSIMEGQVCFR